MSDMNDLCRVYSAVHNSEVREELTESRDLFSEMDLSKMTKVDLYEMAEEIYEEIFSTGFTLNQTDELIGSVLEEVSSATMSASGLIRSRDWLKPLMKCMRRSQRILKEVVLRCSSSIGRTSLSMRSGTAELIMSKEMRNSTEPDCSGQTEHQGKHSVPG